MTLIDKTEQYTAALSTQNLLLVETMYAPGVIYRSGGVGEHRGIPNVMAMLREFFSEYPGFSAETSNYSTISETCVAFDFTINLNGVLQSGVEHLHFDGDQHIILIEVER